jgi:hypothetical protein
MSSGTARTRRVARKRWCSSALTPSDNRKAEALLRRALDEAAHVSEPYLVVRQAAAAIRVLEQRKLAPDWSADA